MFSLIEKVPAFGSGTQARRDTEAHVLDPM